MSAYSRVPDGDEEPLESSGAASSSRSNLALAFLALVGVSGLALSAQKNQTYSTSELEGLDKSDDNGTIDVVPTAYPTAHPTAGADFKQLCGISEHRWGYSLDGKRTLRIDSTKDKPALMRTHDFQTNASSPASISFKFNLQGASQKYQNMAAFLFYDESKGSAIRVNWVQNESSISIGHAHMTVDVKQGVEYCDLDADVSVNSSSTGDAAFGLNEWANYYVSWDEHSIYAVGKNEDGDEYQVQYTPDNLHAYNTGGLILGFNDMRGSSYFADIEWTEFATMDGFMDAYEVAYFDFSDCALDFITSSNGLYTCGKKNLGDDDDAITCAKDADGNSEAASEFYGAGGYYECDEEEGLAATTGGSFPRTWCMWANVTSYNGGALWDTGEYSACKEWSLRTGHDDVMKADMYGDECDFDSSEITLGAWHHYCMVYDGTAVSLYVDGAKDKGVGVSKPNMDFSTTTTNGYGRIAIGAYKDEAPADDGGDYKAYFDGVLDEFRIFNYDLSPAEITMIYRYALPDTDGRRR